jgi:hypothetical protein
MMLVGARRTLGGSDRPWYLFRTAVPRAPCNQRDDMIEDVSAATEDTNG